MQQDNPTTQRILEAAGLAFARHGFAGAKMDAIAAAAKVNKAAIYYHVGNKELLFETILLAHFGPVADMLEQQVVSMRGTRKERLHRLVELVAAMFAQKRPFPRIMLHELATGGTNLSENALKAITRVLRCTLQVLSDGSPVQSGFKPVLAHLNIISALMFSCVATPLVERARSLEGNEEFPAITTQDMATHLLALYDALFDTAPAHGQPKSPTGREAYS